MCLTNNKNSSLFFLTYFFPSSSLPAFLFVVIIVAEPSKEILFYIISLSQLANSITFARDWLINRMWLKPANKTWLKSYEKLRERFFFSPKRRHKNKQFLHSLNIVVSSMMPRIFTFIFLLVQRKGQKCTELREMNWAKRTAKNADTELLLLLGFYYEIS